MTDAAFNKIADGLNDAVAHIKSGKLDGEIASRRAAGQPPFVICEIVSGKVVARAPHSSNGSSGEALIEAARRARGEVA